jgi:hypothetical protein
MKLKIIDFIYTFFILSLVYIYFNNYPLNVDSTWGLYCAKMIIEGHTMYVDMIDVNPPLIFIYSTIPVFISNILNISSTNIYVLFIIFLIFISIYLSWRILIHVNFNSKSNLRLYLYSIIFILTILPSYNFGEREHLLMIFITPYILSIIYNKYLKKFSIYFKTIISLFAALGFNLKPHFFLILIGVELVYFIYKYEKNLLKTFRIEPIIVISSSIIYLITIYFLFPEYIDFMIPFSIDVYTDVFNKPLYILLLNYEFILSVLIITIFLILSKKILAHENIIFLTSIITSIFVYLIQQKGWSYHSLPYFIFTVLFITHLILYNSNKNSLYYIFLFPLIGIIPYQNIINVYQFNSLKKIINTFSDKSSILVISSDIAQGQVLLKPTQVWASRFPSLFMLPAIIHKNNLIIKNYTFNAIYEDLIKYKPDKIIFQSKEMGFDYYQYFIDEDKKLKDFYSKYYRINNKNDYIILEQKEFK